MRAWCAVVCVAAATCGLLAAGPVVGQGGRLTGVVTDAETGAPLEGVEIVLPNGGMQALSTASGRFFLVSLAPGTYTVRVRRVGYQSLEIRNVTILIDLTRTLDVALTPASAVVAQEIVVTAEAVPLIEPGVTGSRTNIRAEEIEALPVTSLWDVLALQQGFMVVPPNSDVIAYVDTRRNPNAPVRVRGGRADETLLLIDGFPANNAVFGGPAFDIGLEAVQQIDYQRGGFDVRYGNAMSGIVNVATREGGTHLEGTLSYQTSGVAGALGSTPDELAGFSLLEGRLSGPVPGTGSRLRFMVAGRERRGADRVLEFDDVLARPSVTGTRSDWPQPAVWGDLTPGWRSFGFDDVRDLAVRLTYHLAPTMKVSGLYTGYERQRQAYDFAYSLTGYDYLGTPGAANYDDSTALLTEGYAPWFAEPAYSNAWVRSAVAQASIRARHDMAMLAVDHAPAGRWTYRVAGGWVGSRRETCNFFQGLCLADRTATSGTLSGFVTGIRGARHPTFGTDDFFGRESVDSYVGSADVRARVTDHHNVAFGGDYQRHDLAFDEDRDFGRAGAFIIPSGYRASPWSASLYVQDLIEYDFLTLKVGLRYDVARAGGLFFANPLDPANGTTAREICDGTVPGVSDAPWTGGGLSGFAACAENEGLLDSAATVAQFDDFAPVPARSRLSPRIGASAAIGERGVVFVNFGQYVQHPAYHVLYAGTSIGTVAGADGGGICAAGDVVPGTAQCAPDLGWPTSSDLTYVGDPGVSLERTTAYEIGFAAEVVEHVALQLVAFGREQALAGLGRGGVREGGRAYDPARTYGTTSGDTVLGPAYDYPLVTAQGYQVVRGVEFTIRRRLADHWGASVGYTLSQIAMTGAAPEREFQWQELEGGRPSGMEIPSEAGRTHTVSGAVYFRVGREAVFGRALLDGLVRHGELSLAVHVASGMAYTPSAGAYWFTRAARYGGTGPATMRVDAFVAKDFVLTNVRVGVFARVVNLLDQRGCTRVFVSTGACDEGLPDPRSAEERAPWWNAPESTYYDRPHYYGERRSINVGARVQF